jgi:diguanylate cyclase (GGDEF)-like protein
VRQIVLPPVLDAAAWGAGTAIAAAGRDSSWTAAGVLLAAFGLLALEAARNALLTDLSQHRVEDLERVRRAADGMIGGGREMAAVAAQIFTQCRDVLRAHWLHLELLAPGAERKSWWSGPRVPIAEGTPEPDRYPPMLRGVHRRAVWQILEHPLRAEGVTMARLRLWCDPRQLEEEDLGLLERLLPQMGASIQRSLLDREAREDPLTGVAVRRVLERRLHEVHARCLEEGGEMAVVMCDLDHFKRINDTFGHGVGDDALVAVAGALQGDLRESDLCARYGGEEFTLLLPDTTGEAALAIAERLRRRVEELDFEAEGKRLPLSVSAGIAAFPELHVKTASELLLFADGALYEAKRRGRNRCLLDRGNGRYVDPEGRLELAEDSRPAPEPPRIFA